VALLDAILPLAGVAIGAAGSYWASTASDRQGWRRQQQSRWDTHRKETYAEYGYAVKAVSEVSRRMAAARGFTTLPQPLDPAEGMAELVRLAGERAAKWESVLLLGSPETIAAARTWHRIAWTMERVARGTITEQKLWDRASEEFTIAREKFYQAARADLGISGNDPLRSTSGTAELRAQQSD